MKIELFILLIFCASLSNGIDWQSDSGKDCDFPGQDIAKVSAKKEECPSKCRENSKCTHYSWNVYGCFLKSGWISKEEATTYKGCICGILADRLDGGKF